MNTGLVGVGVAGIIVSMTLGWLLFSKFGPAFSALSNDFASQRMDEMSSGLFNISSSSIGKGLLVSLLAGLLFLPCGGCLLSLMLIAAGLGSR
jgi:hypothetical protein